VKDGAFAYVADDEKEFLGVNNRAHLSEASKHIWRERAEKHMMNGVSILDPDSFYCDEDVRIENDVEIYPNVTLQGKVTIKSGTIVYPGSRIVDSEIGCGCEIKDNCLISESFVGDDCKIGPMAQLRPGSVLKGQNKLGNFVETKKAVFDIKAQASHLTYVGDAEIGKNVNLGCGTITCNYDGYSKFKTVIGDDVFVGSDVQLVAPVTIGKGALIAAGSTITKDVPEDALGITRSKQKNMDGWVSDWKKKKGVK
jgi:bifunctional UDP-N-acetylglucosamine pyrophosphorylase/glucosamine-1-phosphate N-acetyltransferase